MPKGILGINARNLLYIRPYNTKKAIRFADDKLKTKYFLSVRGIPTARVYYTIKSREELIKFDFDSLPESFVLKPNSGYGGEGILPIVSHKNGRYVAADQNSYSKEQLYDQVSDIIDGRYSISNLRDTAFFEQLIVSNQILAKYSHAGLPDIRVVVHNLIPVMAMLRLPSKESAGKANLHLGAFGVGVDIANGETTHLIYKGRLIEKIDGMPHFERFKVPYWDDILHFSSKIQLLANLGYLACDFAIDKIQGPVLLEINARAGLMVQVANLLPLKKRLEKVKGIKVSSPEHGVRIAQELFGHRIEREIKQISGKHVIGTEEKVSIILKNKTHRIKAHINPGIERSLIDRALAEELGLLNGTADLRAVRLKIAIGHERIQTAALVTDFDSESKFRMMIGRRDLTNFLVDSEKKSERISLPQLKSRDGAPEEIFSISHYREIDEKIIEASSGVKLLQHLRPLNLLEEKEKFLRDNNYDPQFIYPTLLFNPYDLKEKLLSLQIDDSPIGIIFNEKIVETLKKIDLLVALGSDEFTDASIRLFGAPSGSDQWLARRILAENKLESEDDDSDVLDTMAVKRALEQALLSYGLNTWRVEIKQNLIANCAVGKGSVIYLRAGMEVSRRRLESLIVHEIETHVLSAENGKNQPFKIFNRGTAGYLATQEGLAIYNVEQQIGPQYRYLLLVDAVFMAIRGSFSEVVRKMMEYGLDAEDAFRIAMKVKRGIEDTSRPGAFTKDYLYFKGYNALKNYLLNGGSLKKLYMGKVNMADIELLDKVEGLKPPKYLPKWLKNQETKVST